MRCFITFFLFLHVAFQASGQPGFSKKYDLGESLTSFFQCAYVGGDTIAVYGLGYSDDVFLHQQGLVFAKLDTNGNPISHRMLFDSLGNEYTLNLPASFVKLQDGSGYMLLAQVFQNGNGVLLRTDNAGNLVTRYEFEDTLALSKFYDRVIEAENAFYIAGFIQDSTYQTDLFVIKVSKAGKKCWEKTYGIKTRDDYLNSLLQVDEDELVLGGYTTDKSGTPDKKVKFTTKIFAIDSLGHVKWQWETPLTLEEVGATGLFKSDSGLWCYVSGRGVYNDAQQSWYWQPKFIKRDGKMNLVSEKSVGKLRKYINGFAYGFSTQDGGWFAAGQAATFEDLHAYAGWTFRLDAQGDSLWSRYDTAQAPKSLLGCENVLCGAVELPGGSIIACGYTDDFTSKSWGWLLKIDRNGCVDTLNCHPASIAHAPGNGARGFRLYPNPVQTLLHFSDEAQTAWDAIEVANALGQTVLRRQKPSDYTVNMAELKPGVYVVRFVKGGYVLVRTVVKM